MTQQMQKIPDSQQVQQITNQLTAALARGVDLRAQADANDKEVAALRNVLAGLQLGQELQKEIDAAEGAAKEPPKAPAK